MAFDIPSFHRQAVETPSHERVDDMRSLLVDTLEDAGEYPEVDDLGNVVASRGDTDGTHILLNTHIDTVPPHLPYERRTEPPGPDETVDGTGGDGDGDIVCGRGACDAKGPLAALLDAFLTVTPDDGRVTLAISTDEETTQTGGAHLADTVGADGYIVGEPTGLDVCTAARGQFEGTVTIHGESAHAADPGSGHNAIRAAAPVLQAMESYDDKKGPGEHETLGYPILTPSMVEGGEATNQVPAECIITFDRRSVPPETSESFCADLQAHLEQWLPESMDLTVDLIRPDTPFPEAFATDTDAELVRTLQEASGGGVRQFGAATEASYFASNGPTVVFGPGDLSDEMGAVAHSKREYVRLSEVRTAARAVRETVERLV
ncbi:M20 family metallopeptidase [Haloarcula hispanica]|uniref:M20/M25/M40 family metallo-hydrolase n=1 Tax=Haloarcula hispanica TaxID=51589 RepID=A0A482T2D8_HALHI|nr:MULTISPECIES: M20 family metallopeptidase [Haloarcula]KZX48220.1 succinyl-diaminopimelate desuccinylase [Haloarcula sp. K1]MCJ0618326.1 M20 family metallopeptidase [Haloarcula hispanica]RYJ08930.1 M20/M25/M40 family metallo-hydrolase [Haloarcula hispanica]